MLRAMIQLAPRDAATSDVAPPVRELRSLAEFPAVGERAYVIALGATGALAAKAIEVDGATRYGSRTSRDSPARTSPWPGSTDARSTRPAPATWPRRLRG